MESWDKFFDEERSSLLNSIMDCIDMSGQRIQPSRGEVMRMFVLLPPEKIRAIIVGQSPYPNDDACGIPFVSKHGKVPKSLEVLREEVRIEYGVRVEDPNKMVKSWVRQGVFIINSSMTIGKSNKTYLEDHSIVWKEFIVDLMKYIASENIPVLLFGKEAWSLKGSCKSKCILEAPHPVSRGENKFLNCNVFKDANIYLDMIGEDKIEWKACL
jgi:uracil-DNA glycosylase